MTKKVLSIGKDPLLVETRAKILSSRYLSEVEDPSKALTRLKQDHFDLLLVCYSTPEDEASEIVRSAHEEFPHLCIVRLLSVGSPPIEAPVAHRIVTVDCHPQRWISAVEELLENRKQAPFRVH